MLAENRPMLAVCRRLGFTQKRDSDDPGMMKVRLDLAEGADILMVKPALPYLDIIKSLHDTTDVPIAAYQVSGEYAMIHAAARNGWIDLDAAMRESLMAIRRAGATIIITYFAKALAEKR